ncbi:MAG: 1-deoxy-D-xylulose-5-phosphate synthase, partial [bacterium]|nr:1-deoxy-D-xylulose-5-phosphate synthase [bacterium]
MNRIIDTISLPEGLRSLDIQSLKLVAQELRDELISSVSSSGGHFASSLGTVEISVALHHVFYTPKDKLVWDVGHQAYIHKMLTGRKDLLGTIRQKDGLSGFLRREESEHDSFGAGHAGTSISAALGMAEAFSKTDPSRSVVAIIGDGSITAGMAIEALNHTGALKRKLIVILNDNDMSISPNVGALSWLFSKAITSKLPTMARQGFKELHKKGYVPDLVYNTIDRAEEAAVGFFAGGAAGWFESFGFRYIGPLDGHNLEDLVTALHHAKDQDGPVLIHARTAKGKGYQPAEEDPLKWHGVIPFDKTSAKFISTPQPAAKKLPSYSEVFASALADLADKDQKIVAITAAMPTGTGLDKFQERHPNKFYDVAICEQHAVTFAAGLACEGFKPVCAIYSTFLQRAFDQVVHDVCLQNLPVIFAMDRGGVVGNDGHTHQGLFDIAYLRCIPNIVVMSPKDENEFRHMMYTAVNHNGPIAIRYPRGNAIGIEIDPEFKKISIGKAEVVREGTDALVVALGPLVNDAITMANNLETTQGISTCVINARFAKPLDKDLLKEYLPRFNTICTWEDHALMGGFGSAILEFVNEEGIALKSEIKRFGVGDYFVTHASQKEQYQMCG